MLAHVNTSTGVRAHGRARESKVSRVMDSDILDWESAEELVPSSNFEPSSGQAAGFSVSIFRAREVGG